MAGKSMATEDYGHWIRPVSVRPTAEIALDERRFQDGTEPQLLDIITVPMMAPLPRGHQTENHMIDADEYWAKTGSTGWHELANLVDSPHDLWGRESSSTAGLLDRTTPATATTFVNSLWLIKPTKLTIRVVTPGAAFGNNKRRVRASFQYNRVCYDFSVTDLVVEQAFLAGQNGEYPIDQDAYLTVSIGQAHTDPHGNRFCYKFVAAIITEQPWR